MIPSFKSEDDERKFWDTADVSLYFDLNNPIELDVSMLKPTTESISLRLPTSMLKNLKTLAHSKDVPYQSLMKMYLADRVEFELRRKLHSSTK